MSLYEPILGMKILIGMAHRMFLIHQLSKLRRIQSKGTEINWLLGKMIRKEIGHRYEVVKQK